MIPILFLKLTMLLILYYVIHVDTFSLNLSDFTFGPNIFSLNHTQLILESQLDYEIYTSYNFTIEAAEMLTTDNTEPLTSTTTVTVQVIPVNEHSPELIMTNNRLGYILLTFQ